jgi:transglutaminase-like putative cysteine protease
MRFGLVHRVMTDLLAALGVLAIVSTAQLRPGINAALLVGTVLALAVPESWQNKPLLRFLGNGSASLTLLFVEVVRFFFFGAQALDVVVEFATALQVFRLATRRGAAHDQQIIVLALLHFVAGTVLGGGFAYGLCFLGFLVVAPGALVLSHLRREVEGNYRQGARDRTGLPVDVPRILRSRRVVGQQFVIATCLLSIPIFVFTAMLFIAFPRVGLSLLLLNQHPRGRMVGFSDHVDLGQVGQLREDRTLALRFTMDGLPETPPPRMTLRLRGTAFDAYDGHAWKRTVTDRQQESHSQDIYPIYRTPDLLRDKRIVFDLDPIDPPVIFLPPRTIALRARAPGQAVMGEPLMLYRGPEGEQRYGGSDARGLHYEAFLAADNEGLVESMPAGERARYVELAADMPARIGQLAHSWTDDIPTSIAKAKAIEDHLHKEYRYDMNSPSGAAKQPLDDFLFVSHRGHCEYFSSAMAIMLREIGIPSRNVTGFVGGAYNRFGKYYAVRQADAHSWVEAYVEDQAHPTWLTFDPTPAAGAQPLEETTGFWVYVRDLVEAMSNTWARYVVGYDLHQQMRLFEDMSRRYDRMRQESGIRKGPAEILTRPAVLACAAIATFSLAYILWRRRKSGATKPANQPKRSVDPNTETATSLFRALEGALASNGITRPSSLPPLRHAEDLRARRHPLAAEVIALTNVYLEARFGGCVLDDAAKKDYQRRVRVIRAWKKRSEAAGAGA